MTRFVTWQARLSRAGRIVPSKTHRTLDGTTTLCGRPVRAGYEVDGRQGAMGYCATCASRWDAMKVAR